MPVRDFIKRHKGILTFLSVVVIPTIFYVISVETRIGSLQAQLAAVLIIVPNKTDTNNSSVQSISGSPVEQACAELALKAATLHENNKWTAASGIEDLMQKLYCRK